MKRKSQYNYGRRGEKAVAKKLRRKGYDVVFSEGSRGAADIKARKGQRKYNIQVKRTRKGQSPSISADGIRRLKVSASKQGAVPVIAEIRRGKISYRSARIDRKIKP